MPARAKTEPDSQTVGKHRRVAHFRDARSSSGPALCDIAREVVRFRTDGVQSAQGSPNFTQREEPSCDERSISISRRCDRSGRAKHSKTRSCRGRIQARRRALERKPRRRGGQWSSRATARAVAGFLGVTTRAHERRGCHDDGRATRATPAVFANASVLRCDLPREGLGDDLPILHHEGIRPAWLWVLSHRPRGSGRLRGRA